MPLGRNEQPRAVIEAPNQMQTRHVRLGEQSIEPFAALGQHYACEIGAVAVHDVEGEHCEFVLPAGT